MRDLAIDVDMLWYHDAVYWLGSQGTHASAIAVEGYVGIAADGAPRYKVGLSSNQVRSELAVCCDLSIRGLRLLSRMCKLGLDELLTELAAEYKTTLVATRSLRGRSGTTEGNPVLDEVIEAQAASVEGRRVERP